MDFMKEYEKWLASPALSAGEKAELEGRKTVLEAERRTHRRLDALELAPLYKEKWLAL